MLVSVVVPARRWDAHLQDTIASIRAQALPPGVEIETVIGLAVPDAPTPPPPGTRVVHNPSGTIPDALNLAIDASGGDVVVRVDARCVLGPDHVRRVLRLLQDPEVGCVGGAQLVLDRGLFGSAYAVAFNSPLLGPSTYRYGRRSGPIASPYLGAWRREDLVALGGFDPRLLRNQDNELADRVRSSGKVVWYDADLVVGYHNARSLADSMAHHREFGRWRMIQRDQGQRALGPRHAGAIAATAGGGAALVAGLALPRTRRGAVTLLGIAYVAGAAAGSWTARRLRRARPDIPGAGLHPVGVALAPAAAAAIDAAWITGVVEGRVCPTGPAEPSRSRRRRR